MHKSPGASLLMIDQPAALEHQVATPGQIQTLFTPLDTLASARRNHFDIARRRRRTDAAATAAPHAPVPDACVGPTPRSQIRMRTRSDASTRSERDIGAVRELRMVFDCRPQRAQSSISRADRRAARIGVTHRQRATAWTCSPAASNSIGRMSLRYRPSTRETSARSPSLPLQLENLRAGRRFDRHPLQTQAALTHSKRGETADAVARHFRGASIGIEQAHAGDDGPSV